MTSHSMCMERFQSFQDKLPQTPQVFTVARGTTLITINPLQQVFSPLSCYIGALSNLGYFNCQKYQKEPVHFRQSF